MTRYEYVLQWGDKTKNVSVVGNTSAEVIKTAAKIWFPYMVLHYQLDKAIRLMRETGAVILRRPVKI